MTTRHDIAPPRASVTTSAGGRARWLLLLAALAGAAVATLGLVWLLQPDQNQFVDPEHALLRTWLTAGQTAAVATGVGVLGLVAAALALAYQRTERGAAARRLPGWLAVVGLVQTVTIGVGLSAVTMIASAGYVMAFTVPVAVLFIVVQLLRRGGAGRWLALAGVTATVGYGLVSGILSRESVGNMLDLAQTLPRHLYLETTMPFLLIAGVLAWVSLTASVLPTERLGSWVLRHRRAITVLAALGPLPYALVRLTWLTPWPQFAPGDMPAEIRLQGLLISAGAWAGFVLTLGLIQRWGEIFPRWMPGVAGRPVPVWFAAVPGALVATILCAAAVPIVLMFLEQGVRDGLVSALIFPFWLWGPALALAVWGYVLHRRGVPG
ncbi:hypothetical protein [Ornithinimicrobium cavernae]|uniref:hypothetical protein n=1 Tax=Ornithinimicrobium cavernae TaxID=2666047 RepID=UPI0012B17F5A|nr:hypothetical protein [Ornithinimicrobium cavernae]